MLLVRHLPLFLLLAGQAIVLAPTAAVGQVTEAERERLVEAIKAAAEQFDRDELPNLAQSRQQVLQSIDAVRNYFDRRATPENFSAWMDYLNLQPLAEALRSEEQLEEQAREALAVQRRLIGIWQGLELAPLRELRDDVGTLIDAIRFRDPDLAPRIVDRQIQLLAERVGQLDQIPTADQLATLSRIMESLEGSGQADDSLRALRTAFSIPNLRLVIGERAVEQAVGRPVYQQEQVKDCILGTRLVGCACLTGVVSADLVPSSNGASLVLTMNGRFSSRNTGYNGPVRLKTSGTGSVYASRIVSLSETGVRLGTTTTQATLNTRIDSIQHPLRLVRHIARKRAANQKPQAERIALNRVRSRIGSRFAEETAEAVGGGTPPAVEKGEVWLQRLDVPNPSTSWMTTRDNLIVQASVQRSSQLGAAVPAPNLGGSIFAAIQIHETAIDNALGRFLGGRTFTQRDLDKLIASIRPEGDVESEAGESSADSSEDAFEIDFARLRPLIFEARDNSVRLGIRGTRFQQGRRSLDRAVEITAVYRPVKAENGGTELVRDEEVDVDFPGRGRLSVSQAAMRGTIKNQFNDLFPDRLLNKTWSVPMTAQLEAMRGQSYQPDRIEANQGWLTVTIN